MFFVLPSQFYQSTQSILFKFLFLSYLLRYKLPFFTHYSDIDEYGFKRDEDFDYKGYETVMKSYLTVLTNRRIKWDRYMKKKPNLFRNNSNQLKRYVRKGIPGKFEWKSKNICFPIFQNLFVCRFCFK